MTDAARGAVWTGATAITVNAISGLFSTTTMFVLMVALDLERLALHPYWLLGGGLAAAAILTALAVRRFSAPREMWLGAVVASIFYLEGLAQHWASTWLASFGDLRPLEALVASLENPRSGDPLLTLGILLGYPLVVGTVARLASPERKAAASGNRD